MDATQVRERLGRAYGAVLQRFTALRPVQVKAIPPLLEGRGLLVVAPTASGKTEAVLAPVLKHILDQPAARPLALWVCPTRALVNDIFARIEPMFRKVDVPLGVRTGEHKRLRSAALLLTTPESLDVMLSSKDLAAGLGDVGIVVIDEVHLQVGTRRGLQLLMLLQRLEGVTKRRVQRIGLSATVAEPQAAAAWLGGENSDVECVIAPYERETKLTVLGAHEDGIERACRGVRRGLQKGWRKMLVFSNTRNEADVLAEKLESESLGIPVHLHFSSLPTDHRERVEKRFRSQKSAICVATSTLELGIDIGDIDGIFLYGAPGSISSFLQRAGRGNRRRSITEAVGIARTHELTGAVRPDLWRRDVLAFSGLAAAVGEGWMDGTHLPEYWSVGVQQAFSLARYHERIGNEPLLRAAAEGAAPFMNASGVDQLLEGLAERGYLERRGAYGEYFGLTDLGWEWLDSMQIWSNFGDQSEGLPVRQGQEVLEFVSWQNKALLVPGVLVRVQGRTREVTSVKDDHIQVGEPSHAGTPLRPQRTGAAWHISYDLAQAVKSLSAQKLVGESLEPDLQPWLGRWASRFDSVDPESEVGVESGSGKVVNTFLGGTGNALAAALIERSGTPAKGRDFTLECGTAGRVDLSALQEPGRGVSGLAGRLAREVPATVHFGMLPPALAEREVATVLSEPRVLHSIEALARARSRVIEPAPDPEWLRDL